ncbi:MAG: prepilin-type cleavage/methylation domain-containing protein, partial [Helicobacter sp.]|nr:prepilin-type cleavage/methylation domain-containing protein [Helicobacter sp.]
QVFNFKLALKKQIAQPNNPNIDLMELYTNLDLKPSNCFFQIQKNGFVAINRDKKTSFILKNGILECESTKSDKLHNKESLCDIF